MRFPLRLCVPILLLNSCGAPPRAASDPPDAARKRLQADIAFLSADELEGRGTPSRGLELAALYIETQLRAAGVEPAFGATYRQTYSIGSYTPASAKVSVAIDGRPVAASDYVFVNFGRDMAKPMSLPLVRTGNGIVYEEKNVNDLSSHDLKGKAAVAANGAPWALEPAAVFGPDRALGKLMAAVVRGAEMLVYLSEHLDTGQEAEAGFFRQMRHADVGFVRDADLKHASALAPLLVMKPRAIPPNASRIEVTVDVPVREGRASNVLGVIRGTDPALRDEYVVLSAHYDHIGAHTVPAGQDGIWNGADDNASGTAAVLELARRVARQPGRRSVLVFFTSGEDRGIFGSSYYSVHPVVPMNKIAMQLNLDMIGRSQGKVQAIAPHAPAVFNEAVAAGKADGIEVVPDAQTSWRLLYLTDVYHFARHNVPGVFFFTGTHPDYHQPSDTADKIRYDELARITAASWRMLREYADGKPKPAFERPVWFVTP